MDTWKGYVLKLIFFSALEGTWDAVVVISKDSPPSLVDVESHSKALLQPHSKSYQIPSLDSAKCVYVRESATHKFS